MNFSPTSATLKLIDDDSGTYFSNNKMLSANVAIATKRNWKKMANNGSYRITDINYREVNCAKTVLKEMKLDERTSSKLNVDSLIDGSDSLFILEAESSSCIPVINDKDEVCFMIKRALEDSRESSGLYYLQDNQKGIVEKYGVKFFCIDLLRKLKNRINGKESKKLEFKKEISQIKKYIDKIISLLEVKDYCIA